MLKLNNPTLKVNDKSQKILSNKANNSPESKPAHKRENLSKSNYYPTNNNQLTK